jgi:hypothetical protein
MRRILLPCVAAALAASSITAPAHAQPVSFTGSFAGTISLGRTGGPVRLR